ncbi:MAG: hypothetical protein M1827_004417 [Pycnora praestabilis]|nr:MAG: hypothetical protein M1827_004417 [Pycnora praestabilis]
MAAADTIIELKESFLRSQVRQLSAPLQPSRHWRDFAPVPEEGDLKEKVVAEVLYKLNTIARRHNKAAYSSQALRHVAEQIDALYWAAGAVDSDIRVGGEEVLEKGVDLTANDNIAKLPEEWPADQVSNEADLERYHNLRRYEQLQARLKELSAQRQAQQQKMAQYKHLQRLLEPLKDPQKNVQPNLVTRDGELGPELDRMRMLMARVAGKVEALNESGMALRAGYGDVGVESTESKLASVWALR